MELSKEALDGLEALGREAAQRELERNADLDAEAVKELTEAELRAAELFKMSPSEYLRFKSVRP
jgi:hypothetical protein